MSGHIFKNLWICKSSIIFVTVLGIICGGICICVTVLGGTVLHYDLNEYLPVFAMCYYFVYLMCSISMTSLFTCDERAVWVCFAASTPSSAKGQVLSKYYTMLLVNVWITFICYISNTITSLIFPEVELSLAIYVIFLITVLYNAFTMPFYIRFGGDKGLGAAGITAGIIVFAVFVYFLFGDISFIDLDDPMAAIRAFLSSDWMLYIYAFLPYVTIALYYASYRISLILYRKGSESYGQ